MARKASFDRAQALTQAMNLFWARGFHATSLKDIEAALDMRPGSIYAAFGSKEALFAAALERYAAESRARFDATLTLSGSPLKGLAAHIRNIATGPNTAAPSRACMLMKTILETPEEDAVLRVAAEGLMRETETAFRAAFAAAQEAGELSAKQDPALLAARLQAQILGLRAYAQRSDSTDRVPHIAESLAQEVEALAG